MSKASSRTLSTPPTDRKTRAVRPAGGAIQWQEETFLPNLSASSIEEALAAIVGALAQVGAVIHAPGVVAALVEREHVAPTAVGEGVAIPHCRSILVRRPAIAFARLASPLDFGAADGEAVRALWMLVAPESMHAEEYLKLLAGIAGMVKEAAVRKAIAAARTFAEFHKIVVNRI